MAQRPDFIKHYREIQKPAAFQYSGSDEPHSIGSPFGQAFGLKRIGIHHEVLPPGQRTSWPHAEEDEEEFVYVLEGEPDVWVDGELHRLVPGDAVGFPCGTGISHTIINNTEHEVRLLVVGEAAKPKSRIFYPLHPERRAQVKDRWWDDVPVRTLGPHDGLPDARRRG